MRSLLDKKMKKWNYNDSNVIIWIIHIDYFFQLNTFVTWMFIEEIIIQ